MNTSSRKYSNAILLIACLFTLKALYLGFYVTPLWDIPDETAHFAYVRDLAEGRGIPLLGTAKIGSDIMSHMRRAAVSKPASNIAALHPPVYYFFAAIPLKAGMIFTKDSEINFRLPRIIAAISGGLLLLVLYRAIRTLGLEEYKATLLASFVSFIPMVSHMSSGTNHDMTLFLFCALTALFFARFVVQQNVKDAYLSAFWLTLAGGIKMTAWVLIPPVLFFIGLEMRCPVRYWLKNMIGVFSVSLLVPVMWMARNVFYFSNPFYTAGNHVSWQLKTPLNDTLFEYINKLPVFEHFFLQFYGILGGGGTGRGVLKWFMIGGVPRSFFSILMLMMMLLIAFFIIFLMCRSFKTENSAEQEYQNLLSKIYLFLKPVRKYALISTFSIAIFFSFAIFMNSFPASIIRNLFVVFFVFAGVSASGPLLYEKDLLSRFLLYSMLLCMIFATVLLWEVYGIYLKDGRLRATQGRYFYPIIPFFIAALSIVVKRFKIPAWLICGLVVALAVMELEVFVLQAIPFYLGGY